MCVVLRFVVVFGLILYRVGAGLAGWADNNSKPILSEPATVVAKRTETSGQFNNQPGAGVQTWYDATFELPSGERREFTRGGKEYGLLAEGDRGTLIYQGTRYHGFERQRR